MSGSAIASGSQTSNSDSDSTIINVPEPAVRRPSPPTTRQQLANITVSATQTLTAGGFTTVFAHILSYTREGLTLGLIGKAIGESNVLQGVFTGVHVLSGIGLVALCFTPNPLGSRALKSAFLMMQTTAVGLYTYNNHFAEPTDRSSVIGYAILPLIQTMMVTGAIVANRMKMLPTTLKRTAIASAITFAAHATFYHSVMLHTEIDETASPWQAVAATATVSAVTLMNAFKLIAQSRVFCQSRKTPAVTEQVSPTTTSSTSCWSRASACVSRFFGACRRQKPTIKLPGRPETSSMVFGSEKIGIDRKISKESMASTPINSQTNII